MTAPDAALPGASGEGRTDAQRLRDGAKAMRACVGPEAWAIPLIADALDADAARLERGEPVDDLAESLALADGFTEEVES